MAHIGSLEFADRFASPTSYAHWAGLTVAAVVVGTWTLRAAVILHNKKMARYEERPDIAVPSWHYATWVMCLALAADVGIVVGIAMAVSSFQPSWLLLGFAIRLPLHAAVLAWLLAASYRAAMIVQIFEIAIAMVLAPLVATVVALVYV